MKSSEELVRARIDEKRIFEARFLLSRLGEEIPEKIRKRLDLEVSNTIATADRVRFEARLFLDEKKYEQAAEKYTELETLIVDFPRIDEEKKRVFVACSLNLNTPSPAAEETSTPLADADFGEKKEVFTEVSAVSRFQVSKKLVLILSLFLFIAVLLLLYFNGFFVTPQGENFFQQAALKETPVNSAPLGQNVAEKNKVIAVKGTPPPESEKIESEASGVRINSLLVVEEGGMK